MARARAPDPAKTREALLIGLRKAADGAPRPLQGTAGQGALFTTKGEAAAAEQALAEGYLEETDASFLKKPGDRKAVPRYVCLTDRGRQLLVEEDSPKKLLETLLPMVQGLAEQLAAGTRALESTTRLVNLVLAKLGGTSPAPTVPPSPAPKPAAAPKAVPAPQSSATSVRDALHSAYEKLCLMVDFRDGVVELPRLFHEAQRTLPTLNAEQFHQELRELWQKREIELHILNEVRTATEPQLGIWRDNHLYYFIFWRRP